MTTEDEDCKRCGGKGFVVVKLLCKERNVPCICTPCGAPKQPKPLVSEDLSSSFESFGK